MKHLVLRFITKHSVSLLHALGTFLEYRVGKPLTGGIRRIMSDEPIKSAAELAAERAAKAPENDAPEAQPSIEDLAAAAEAAVGSQSGSPDLAIRLASMTEELEGQKDKYVRLVAEFDNFRKRTSREFMELADAAQGRALAGLFPVVDNFERAFADAPAEGDWMPADPAAFAKGMRLIRDQLRKVIADAGLQEISGEGTPFDPNLHDALTQMPHPSVPADHVAAVHARGWRKGEKILRHAQVVVSSGPAA